LRARARVDEGSGQGHDVGELRPPGARLSLPLSPFRRLVPARRGAEEGFRPVHEILRRAAEKQGESRKARGERKKMMRLTGLLVALSFAAAGCASAQFVDPRQTGAAPGGAADPGCTSTTLVSTGGPFPRNPGTLALRWTGYANFELAFNGQVVLL